MVLNTDGSAIGNPSLAGCAGVFRSNEGIWLGGFQQASGVCNSLEAELWGVYKALSIA